MVSAAPAGALSGADAADASYAFTAKLNIADEQACSGALVDPQWVLTAASCFVVDGKATQACAPTVTVGRTDLNTTAGIVVDSAYVVPHADRDIAMVKLAKPVTGITPVKVATRAPTASDKVIAAGFGRTKIEWVPDKTHCAAFTVDGVGDKTVDPHGSADAVIYQGDAGGPALRDNNGTPELVAVNSQSWPVPSTATATTTWAGQVRHPRCTRMHKPGPFPLSREKPPTSATHAPRLARPGAPAPPAVQAVPAGLVRLRRSSMCDPPRRRTRHRTGRRRHPSTADTARTNLATTCDPGHITSGGGRTARSRARASMDEPRRVPLAPPRPPPPRPPRVTDGTQKRSGPVSDFSDTGPDLRLRGEPLVGTTGFEPATP
ncbi:S1 family peptidase [Streptomyces sp. NPDC056670]|uniref:S1 family peptidase n=1 Tax=Streptomyces sp. NPDC056670 TaxID=3345904 RepID=UPI0036CDC671